jgi:hypothetical protein
MMTEPCGGGEALSVTAGMLSVMILEEKRREEVKENFSPRKKEIEINLAQGVYILHVVTRSGRRLAGRVVKEN